jgi:hypothetical protein
MGNFFGVVLLMHGATIYKSFFKALSMRWDLTFDFQ